jgi:hypothetical protein
VKEQLENPPYSSTIEGLGRENILIDEAVMEARIGSGISLRVVTIPHSEKQLFLFLLLPFFTFLTSADLEGSLQLTFSF